MLFALKHLISRASQARALCYHSVINEAKLALASSSNKAALHSVVMLQRLLPSMLRLKFHQQPHMALIKRAPTSRASQAKPLYRTQAQAIQLGKQAGTIRTAGPLQVPQHQPLTHAIVI